MRLDKTALIMLLGVSLVAGIFGLRRFVDKSFIHIFKLRSGLHSIVSFISKLG